MPKQCPLSKPSSHRQEKRGHRVSVENKYTHTLFSRLSLRNKPVLVRHIELRQIFHFFYYEKGRKSRDTVLSLKRAGPLYCSLLFRRVDKATAACMLTTWWSNKATYRFYPDLYSYCGENKTRYYMLPTSAPYDQQEW